MEPEYPQAHNGSESSWDLPEGTVRAIVRQAGLTVSRFLRL